MCRRMDHTERLIRRVLAALALHPGLAGGGEGRTEALLVYARRAVGIGAPFDADTLDALGPLSPEDIVTASGNLPDKLSAEAREDHARRAQEGGQEGQATVERFFEGRQSVVRALLLDGPGLAERVRIALDRHNAAAETGTATGRYGRWRARGGLDDKGLVELEALDRSSTQKKRASEVLAAAREWELADDLERAAAPAAEPPARGNPDAHLASRKPIQAWGAIGPASFAIVYSRDPRLVGECSTGQRWTNCFTENNSNFESVGAHIQHGAVVAYLVDRDDPDARYPHLRILLTPMGGVDRNGMRSGEERVFGESRTFGSLGYGGAEITERFRQSVLDAARLLSGGLHGQFHTVRGIPFSDAGAQRFRISEWTPNDLRSEIERTIERRDPGRSLQDHVDLKRRLGDALERRGDRALRDDVDRVWGRFAMARQATDALAGAAGREDVRKLVTDLRDRSFALMPDGLQQLPQAAAMQAMRPVLDDFLKMHPMPAAATTALGIDAMLLAAASPVVGGDVICAALLASLEGGPRRPDVPFELCGELPCHLRTLQVRRWQHMSAVAAGRSREAVAERDRAVRTKEGLPDDLGVGAIHDAFQGAWFSLRMSCDPLGPRAWDRLRAAALRTGVGAALDEVQQTRSRMLGTDLLVLAVLMRRSIGTKLRDVREAAL